MSICRTKCWVLYFVVLLNFLYLITAQNLGYPTANLSTSWINVPSLNNSINFTEESMMRPILFSGNIGLQFVCGFFCNGNCDSYLFAIVVVNIDFMYSSYFYDSPQVVWSANRNNPVRINATLQLTPGGDLVLKDVDGSIAWSTNTASKSVTGLKLTDTGNLVLFDGSNEIVWQSFDHPTDCLLLGQKLRAGQKLTPSVSSTNWTQQGLFSLSVTSKGLFASIESNPPQVYFDLSVIGAKMNKEPTYVSFLNGSLALFFNSSDPSEPDTSIALASSSQYLRFGPDGHLRVYSFQGYEWTDVADVFKSLGECDYPTVCGNYGICSDGQCSCPPSTSSGTTYFKQISGRHPDLGCSETTPLSCEASQYHSFVELKDTRYFTFRADLDHVDLESCKAACSRNCSCKAAIFLFYPGYDTGYCYLPSQIFSPADGKETASNTTVHIKVQILPDKTKRSQVPKLLGTSLGSLFGLLLLIGILVLFIWKNREADESEEDYLDHIPGMPMRFSYEDLKAMTQNFTKVLGEGGFGKVFEGTLNDGTKIAVKHLNGLGQVKKLFLTEVEAIGSIHHVNLVRLLGFCADKSRRLLVYEHMSNGSLDKWIFHKTHEFVLDWQQRKKIILDIAKGLAYLHEDCRQKIIHLDIKPQNILLNDNFDAKISDFGLSKLIDREQSKVVTTMRGTPGYLAPEWLSSIITEKVDVYSFGIVILEILCRRRNFDRSQPDEQMHLLSFFKQNAEEDQLIELVDNNSEDVQLHISEMLNMMRVAAWCLQGDYAKRPSMSVVVKVLEGVMEVEHNLDYSLSNTPLKNTLTEVTPLLPSVLSGPR